MSTMNPQEDVGDGVTQAPPVLKSPGADNAAGMALDFDPLSFEFKETTSNSTVTKVEYSQTVETSSNLVNLDMFDPLAPVSQEPGDNFLPEEELRKEKTYSAEEGLNFQQGFDADLENSIPPDSLDNFESCQESENVPPQIMSSATKQITVFTDADGSVTTRVTTTSSTSEIEEDKQYVENKQETNDTLQADPRPLEAYSDRDTNLAHKAHSSSSISSESSVEIGETDTEVQYSGDMVGERVEMEDLQVLGVEGESTGQKEDFKEADQVTQEENIISVAKLKTTYTSGAEEGAIQPGTKEKVETGVNLKSLSTSFSSQQGDDTSRDSEVIDTGISVSQLKSNLTDQQEDSVEKEPLEEVKPSVDRAKVTQTFNQSQQEEQEVLCKVCGKHVYLMDKIMAVKSAFHKSCFRCKECGKSLNVDTYSSHGGEIYCKPHHKQLFQPKVNIEDTSGDVGETEERTVEDLDNIRSRFESPQQEEFRPISMDHTASVKRTESIQARMAKYQSAVGKSCHDGDKSTSSEDEDDTAARVKNVEIKETIGAGRSEIMRAAYERACKEASSGSPTRGETVTLGGEVKAVNIKEKFEKGALDLEKNEKMERARREKEEDLSIVNETRDSVAEARTLFKQFDTVNTTTTFPLPGRPSLGETKRSRELTIGGNTTYTIGEVVKCSEPGAKEQVELEPAELQERFKYFENYKESKPQAKYVPDDDEVPRDPKVIRASDVQEEVMVTDTAKRMLDKFKQLENQGAGLSAQSVAKPVRKITPPRETLQMVEKHEPSPEPDHDPDVIRCTYKVEDDMTWKADQAKSLKAKFEHWDTEVERESKVTDDEGLPESDTTKNLRAKFEAIRAESTKIVDKPQPRGKKFAELGLRSGEDCDLCGKKLYPMERMEASSFKFHKNCFRCSHCNSMLRLDNYTINSRKFYCTPHFKQFFKSKGSYEDGFIDNNKKETNENGDASDYTDGDTPDMQQVTVNQEVAV
ncbi:uncharacterized protein LOC106478060 isoform X2 [Limulus polyphemus]|uniref:Uncharacterized protein LOC106478060 isoform X2 n=1 Tax=Limulus polyphemus TaxID=6850 RepID=A0ABM1C4K8_LIMPO|nr:uncharacterized protein LOC106478060 isoform X2 [Limulus polyphemus]